MNILKKSWKRGLEPFLLHGVLAGVRIDREPLTDSDVTFIRLNKKGLMAEIEKYSSATRIDAAEFYGPGLMEDAAARAGN